VIRVLRTPSLPEGVLLWVRPCKEGYLVYVAPSLLDSIPRRSTPSPRAAALGSASGRPWHKPGEG
jgi:hypothetical protein